MNTPLHSHDNHESDATETEHGSDGNSDNRFKKLKRPEHAAKRSKTPARLRGMHRRKRKRMNW